MKPRISSKTKGAIVRGILERFRRDPESLLSFFPEIYQELVSIQAGDAFVPDIGERVENLTELERKSRGSELERMLGKLQDRQTASRREGLELLEHLAILGIRHVKEYLDVVRAAEHALGVDFCEEKDQTRIFRKGRTGKIQRLLPGIDAYLTWDGKILRIKWNKNEIHRRNKAASLIGLDRESRNDPAMHSTTLSREGLR